MEDNITEMKELCWERTRKRKKLYYLGQTNLLQERHLVIQWFSFLHISPGQEGRHLCVALWGPRPLCLIPIPFPRVVPSLAGLQSCPCSAQRKEAVWKHFCSVIGSRLRNSLHYCCSCSCGEYCYVARPNCKEGWEMQTWRAALYPEQGRE